MSENSFTKNPLKRLGLSLGVIIWAVAGFMIAAWLLVTISRPLPTELLRYLSSEPPGILLFNALTFLCALGIIIGGGYWWARIVLRKPTDTAAIKQVLGVDQAPDWRRFGLLALCALGYVTLSIVLLSVAQFVLPNFRPDQTQNIGYSELSGVSDLVFGFIGLVILTPIVEELLFRGYIFGALRRYNPMWVSTLITSILFGLAHGQWNVGIDVFALSIFLCILREKTGSIWMSMLLHGLKNGLAYYFLFIDPLWRANGL